jgi:hypothetical protein
VSNIICYAIWIQFLYNLSKDFRKSKGIHFYYVYWRGQQSKPLILCFLIRLVYWYSPLFDFFIFSLILDRRILKSKFPVRCSILVSTTLFQPLAIKLSLFVFLGGSGITMVVQRSDLWRACTCCSSRDDRYTSFCTSLCVCAGSSFVLCYIAISFSPKYGSLNWCPPCRVKNWPGIQEYNDWWMTDWIVDFSEILNPFP